MQVIRLNQVIRDFCKDNPRAAFVEMNDVIYERGHFSDFIMHLKPERSYWLAMRMLESMTHMPVSKGLRESLPVGQRSTVLWSDEISLLPNYLSLCAMGSKPDYVISTQTFNSEMEAEKVETS